MVADDFLTSINKFNLQKNGSVSAESPSNIALVKYWGKTYPQTPTNTSISFTLSQSYTRTTLEFVEKKGEDSQIKVFLGEVEKPTFVPKIERFFNHIKPYAPYVAEYDFVVKTHNSFPHSSGIASSASGFSALAKCLVEMEDIFGYTNQDSLQRASFLARLGSGSACRSLYNGLVSWGEHKAIPHSSNLFASPLQSEVHRVYKTFQDTILLIDQGSKQVSSTVGHQLMENHPYAATRFKEANQNIERLIHILATNDIEKFGKLVEHEALSLHAMMMVSNPAFILMQPNTVEAIQAIWRYRKESHQPLYFTLDAGANIHLLYPEEHKVEIHKFIHQVLLNFCEDKKAIFDSVNS